MTISWSFSGNSFVKFHGKKNLGPQDDPVLYPNSCYNIIITGLREHSGSVVECLTQD